MEKSEPVLEIHLLGLPRFELDGTTLELRRRKVEALLVYLAVTGKTHNRDFVVDLLYPAQNRSNALADFRRTLAILKKAIGERRLSVDRKNVSLPVTSEVWVDVHEFRCLVEQSRSVDRSEGGVEVESEQTLQRLNEAARLYRGDFLTGFFLKDSTSFEEWQYAEQESLRREYAFVLSRLVKIHGDRGEYRQAIDYERRRLSLDHLDEAVHRHLMQLFRLSGQREAALRQYETYRVILAKELGQTPDGETEALFREIRSERPAPQILSERRTHNLPYQPTRFIGRGEEKAEVLRVLLTTHLLTLTGAGGCGKTRLALEVALEVRGEYEDGVWLMDLAPLADPEGIPRAVVAALGIWEQAQRATMDVLTNYLRRKRLLLMLDNCEHLIGSCAELVSTLLKECAGLKVLATSREPLRIGGETVWRVPSLSLPDLRNGAFGGAASWMKGILRSDAVEFFVDRAKAAFSGFAVGEENARSVAQICRRLDGIPLALELAAARASVLSCDQIVARLDDRFALLTEGSRTALPRHRTLRETIDWSHGLLSEDERVLLRRLSVFSGGCTLEAAEKVCGGDVLDPLSHLVDKSMVLVEKEKGEVRYRLLETIRQYGWAKLGEANEIDELRTRHRDWFLELAERGEIEIRRCNQKRWFHRLERNIDNFRAALDWCRQTGDKAKELRVAGSLGWFWCLLGYWHEAHIHLLRALTESGHAPSRIRAKGIYMAGTVIKLIGGNSPLALKYAEESLSLYRDLGDKKGIAEALHLICHCHMYHGDAWHGTARSAIEESLSLSEEIGDELAIVNALHLLGETYIGIEDWKSAKPVLAKCLTLARRLGDRISISFVIEALAELAQGMGELEKAEELCLEGLRIAIELDSRTGELEFLVPLGRIYRLQGRYLESKEAFTEAIIGYRDLNLMAGTVVAMPGIADWTFLQSQPRRAARIMGIAYGIRERCGLSMPDHLGEIFTTTKQKIQGALPKEIYDAEYAAGRSMSFEEAVAYALEEE